MTEITRFFFLFVLLITKIKGRKNILYGSREYDVEALFPPPRNETKEIGWEGGKKSLNSYVTATVIVGKKTVS